MLLFLYRSVVNYFVNSLSDLVTSNSIQEKTIKLHLSDITDNITVVSLIENVTNNKELFETYTPK